MGVVEVLTIVFVVLKLVGVINWSWWLVLLPEIIAVVVYVIFYGYMLKQYAKLHREVNKALDDDFFK